MAERNFCGRARRAVGRVLTSRAVGGRFVEAFNQGVEHGVCLRAGRPSEVRVRWMHNTGSEIKDDLNAVLDMMFVSGAGLIGGLVLRERAWRANRLRPRLARFLEVEPDIQTWWPTRDEDFGADQVGRLKEGNR